MHQTLNMYQSTSPEAEVRILSGAPIESTTFSYFPSSKYPLLKNCVPIVSR